MFYKSIRFKITIVYMAILALTLSVFSAALYHYVSVSLYENMDTLLRSKAEGIVHAINTYWATEKIGTKRYGTGPDQYAKDEMIDFATIAQKWVQERYKDPKLLDIIIQIYDPDGTVVASSRNTQGIAGISEDIFISALDGKSIFDTLAPSFPTKKLVSFRVFITPAVQNERVEYVVEVASPLTSIQTTLDTMKVTLFILFPLTVLVTGVMGSLLATLSLRPVDSMIKTIHAITAENMKLSLALPGTRDEIEKLAETFNDMLARLDNAFTSQKRLFEDLSHDLKTPLTVMKGEFEVILKKTRSAEEYEAVLKSSLEEANKIIRLVDNLLMLASFESKKILPERRDLDLGVLVQGIATTIGKLALKKDIEMRVVKADGITVKADEQQLKQLFFNLLDNAVKYTNPSGVITVRIARDGGLARIEMQDTGIGMTEEHLAHVFDRFYRADKSGTDQGFGLGLSIVKSVVDAHGGTITVKSRYSAGTTFIITLPIA